MSQSRSWKDMDLDILKRALDDLRATALLSVSPGVINWDLVESEIRDIEAEIARRNEEPPLWKCACGRFFGPVDLENSTGTLLGLTVSQIMKLRLRWLSEGKKIEDI